MRQTDIYSCTSERITIAPTAVVGLTAQPGQSALTYKLLSGGTLEIGGQSQAVGSMYPVSGNEIMNLAAGGKIWLYASGATCVVAVFRGKTDGV
jgi:hypothetical protein